MALTIRNIIIDSGDAAKAADFWAAATGWSVEPWSHSGEAAVAAPGGDLRLYFMRVPEQKTVKNRVHLDLEPDVPAAAEIERLTGLGATKVRAYDSYTVLTDPEGNEFCVMNGTGESA